MKIRFKTLADVYSQSIKNFAGRKFLGEKKNGSYQWMTYADFGKLTDEARSGLAALGVGKDDRIASIADNCSEWAVMAFATYGLGAWYVPMYEAQLPTEWEFIMKDCEAGVVVVANAKIAAKCAPLMKSVPSLKTMIVLHADGALPEGAISLADLQAKGRAKPVPVATIAPEDVAGLIYTSGTTGKPKGVMLTHSNIANNLNAILEVFAIDPNGETSLAFLPWAHAFGQVAELYLLFSCGSAVALAESPNTLIANLAEVKPTILYSVPRVWNKVYANLNKRMAEAGGLKKQLFDRALVVAAERAELKQKGKSSLVLDLQFKLLDKLVFSKVRAVLGGNLKYAISGAAALSPEVARFVSYVGITVCEGYGLTETSPAATFNPAEAVRIGTVGIPVPGVTIRVIPAENAPEGQGEVVISGHNVMKGYYKRPEETAAVILPDGGFRTGDLGFIDKEGYLHITGRVKEQYKLENGKYVAPAPLEEAIKLSPYIGQIFIHGANKPYNVALVVLNAENMPGWAAEHGLAGKPMAELCKSTAVRKLIQDEIGKLSSEFKGFEKLMNFALIPEDFSSENGMLTPTLKIKRNVVLERYNGIIEGLYKKDAAVA
jgi:long-chain acyl-CoA synthetase